MRVFGADVAPPGPGVRRRAPLRGRAPGQGDRSSAPRRGARAARAPARRRARPGRSRARSRGRGADPRPGARRLRARPGQRCPSGTSRPRSSTAELRTAAAQARVALSAPVYLTFGETRWRLPRWRIAELLALPKDGGTALTIGGRGAERWFERLAENVNHPAEDAGFSVDGNGRDGGAGARRLRDRRSRHVGAPAREAVLSSTSRVAPLAVATAKPERTHRRRAGDGDHDAGRRLHDDVRRRGEPAAQRPARRRADRRRADRARRRVLVQRDDRRADRPTRASSRRP